MKHDQDTRAMMALVRDALSASGLLQIDFAAAAGTSASRLSNHLTGRTRHSGALLLHFQRIGGGLRAARSEHVPTSLHFGGVAQHAG